MVTINSIDSNIPIEISKGGTNATSMATATGLVKYDGTSLVTSATATLDASNRMTNTAQPAFLAYLDAARTNVTGDGSNYTIVWGNEAYDQGNNFDNVSTFTAPITGKYLFSANVFFQQLTASHTAAKIQIVTTNRTYEFDQAPVRLPSNEWYIETSAFADMNVTDTAYVVVSVDNDTKVVDVSTGGGADPRTYFSGALIC